jgi:hypothetical protein
MGSLWTVCDCYAQPSPVLPAVPCFDLKKHLLGKMHPIFAALVAGMSDDSCQGPLCALLPQLPVLNTSLPEIQIPMMLLANLTALLKPQPLPDVAPLAGELMVAVATLSYCIASCSSEWQMGLARDTDFDAADGFDGEAELSRFQPMMF